MSTRRGLLFVVCLLVLACSGKPVESFGQPISIKEMGDLTALVKESQTTTTEVLVQGSVKEVCQKKGCWMVVTAENSQVRVTFKDYGFFVPKDCAGRKVKMQGMLVNKTLTQDEARHYAEDAGKSKEEIEKIVGDQQTLEFVASGVELI